MRVATSLSNHTPAQEQVQRWRRDWHSDSDIADRRQLIHHIFQLLVQRRPNVTQELREKLPDFVKRLEEALYQGAASKEEYVNTTTLDERLQNVARTFVSQRPLQQSQQSQPTPGSAGPDSFA